MSKLTLIVSITLSVILENKDVLHVTREFIQVCDTLLVHFRFKNWLQSPQPFQTPRRDRSATFFTYNDHLFVL